MIVVVVEGGHQVEVPGATKVRQGKLVDSGTEALELLDEADQVIGAFKWTQVAGYVIKEDRTPRSTSAH